MRTALGAGRNRLSQQVITESILLFCIGGGAGVALAAWSEGLLTQVADRHLPGMVDVRLDLSVILISLILIAAGGIFAGVAPALYASRISLNDVLKEGSQTVDAGSRRGSRTRGHFVVSEVALAVLLLTGFGVFLRNFRQLLEQPLGFNPTDVITTTAANVSRLKSRSSDQRIEFLQSNVRAAEAMPGVNAAALISETPLADGRSTAFTIDEHPPVTARMTPFAKDLSVSPNYFTTLRIPVLKGRVFTERDNLGNTPVTIISHALAQQYFPDEDPIGKHITFVTATQRSREIIGVVGDVRQGGPGSPFAMHAYLPCYQTGEGSVIYVRTRTGGYRIDRTLRQTLAGVDNQFAWGPVRSLSQAVYEKLGDRRLVTIVTGAFAALALALAIVGIYGMIAYSVTRRTRDFGIRMALGSTRHEIVLIVLFEITRLVLLGIVLGTLSAAILLRVLSSQMFGVTSLDLATCVVVSLALILASLLAGSIPAYRATRLDPIIAIRSQ